MDNLKGVDHRPWIHNEKIKVSSFLDLWKSQDLNLELNLNESNIEEQFSQMFSIDQEMVDSVKEDSASENLIAENDKDWKNHMYGHKFALPEHVKLESVAAQASHMKRFETDPKYRVHASNQLKYRNYTFLNNQTKSKKPSENGPKITELDVVLNVQIFQPMHSSLYVGDYRKHVIPIATQEFLCLGNQFLTSLKDEINCPIDLNPAEDCSDEPNIHANNKPRACEIYTSSFFFIDDCFFNDFRKATNIDYSQVILEWAKNTDKGIGELRTASMEETRFMDLSVRLGQPYLYVHQGNCEHMLVFSEMRLFSPQTDSPFLSDYPKIYKTANKYARKCSMCHINVSKWAVLENKRLPYEPFFFCNPCFLSFNYNAEGQKIGHFKAIPYLDKSAIF